MNIEAEKTSIIERFRLINDRSLINAIKGMLDYAQSSNTERISTEQYNKELEQAEEEIAEGKGSSHSDFKQEMEQW